MDPPRRPSWSPFFNAECAVAVHSRPTLDLMKTFLQKRGVLAAMVAGAVFFVLSFLGLVVLYWLLRPFVWAAVYGVAYSPPRGPYNPNSGEWLFVQGIGFLSTAAAGFACAKWSKAQSPLVAIGVALALLFLVVFFGELPAGVSYVRKAIFFLGQPIGIVCGALLFFYVRNTLTRRKHED